jgi:hypothetical protein
MAKQLQESLAGPHQQGQGQFLRAPSPFGTRPGLSPNPVDTKGRTPKLGRHQLPGSPLPDSGMQPQYPNLYFSPDGLPFYQREMPQNMMPPPSPHPGANFNGQQPTPQQVEAMRNGQNNGQSQNGMQPLKVHHYYIPDEIPAPPAPARRRRNPRRPVPSSQEIPPRNPAPPTPDQTSETAPKKKGTKSKKVHFHSPPSPLQH